MSNDKFIHKAETDHGTILHSKQVAVIVTEDGFQFLIPDSDEVEISEAAQALVAAAMKIEEDEDFKAEMMEVYDG